MSDPEKPRFPFHVAGRVAVDLITRLAPLCAPWPDGQSCGHTPRRYCTAAGSLRRLKGSVGDIEILYVPTTGPHTFPGEMLPRAANLFDVGVGQLLSEGILAKRPKVDGSFTWGELIKLAVHVPTGLPVDLFATTPASWFNYLVCRTGPKISNMQIATEAQRRGWKWEPYSDGFLRADNSRLTVAAEAEVFAAVGLPAKPPWDR